MYLGYYSEFESQISDISLQGQHRGPVICEAGISVVGSLAFAGIPGAETGAASDASPESLQRKRLYSLISIEEKETRSKERS